MALSYIEKFEKLPLEARKRFGSPTVKQQIETLEKSYHTIDLLPLLIRMIVGDTAGHDIEIALEERGTDIEKVGQLARELETKILVSIRKLLPEEKSISDVDSKPIVDSFQQFMNSAEVREVHAKVAGHGASKSKDNFESVKSDFYQAINAQDKKLFFDSLAILFSSGKLEELFRTEKRYIKFWRSRVLKEKGLEGVRRFDENPMNQRIFGKFLKYVMEERFAVVNTDTPKWATYLSSLAHFANDKKFEKIGYGDLQDQKFKWNL